MDALRFTFSEVLSLLGVVQCVYVLVHVAFRAKNLVRVFLPMFYFFTLGLAFLIDFGRGFISEFSDYYDVMSWAAWNLTVPVSVLLILQMAHIDRLPSLINWLVLLFVPIAYALAQGVVSSSQFMDFLYISGGVMGAVSLLVIWLHRTLFSELVHQKAGRERYWLVVTLILVNVLFLAHSIYAATSFALDDQMVMVRTAIGLAFIYLVSTSLFRIYPVVLFSKSVSKADGALSNEEVVIAQRIESLLSLEKIYHEASYSRTDLARELNVAEGVVSRVINVHFGKSFPQLLNEHRIDDAKRLLLETSESVKVVAEEVGFNSLASFNRAFKEMVGQSPSSYRSNTIK